MHFNPEDGPWPFAHSFGGDLTKKQRERGAARQSCSAMQRLGMGTYRPVPIASAVRRGLVREVAGATVDAVIVAASGPVAVELLSYSPVRDRGDVMVLDRKLRRALCERIKGRRCRPRCNIQLGYRTGARSGGTGYLVPKPHDFPAVGFDLLEAVEATGPLGWLETVRVRFVEHYRPLGIRLGQDERRLDASRYPTAAKYLEYFSLTGTGALPTSEISSCLRSGCVGLDSDWMSEQLLTKAQKSIRWSQARANGLPLWLIVHSDGHAIHQNIHYTNRSRALTLCRTVLGGVEHAFDEVYWADQTGFAGCAWVGRALPAEWPGRA